MTLATAKGRPVHGSDQKPLFSPGARTLLYLISPLVLLAVWRLLLMAGFGDRRFIPTPPTSRSNAGKITVGMLPTMSATVWRAFSDFLLSHPGHRGWPADGMFRPVRLFSTR